MDSLCNHKEAATKWADGETPKCACDALRPHALHGLQPDHHLVLDGDNLHFDDGPHTSIATGSLQNKIFPPSKEIQTSLRKALRTWTTRNSLPSLQKSHIDELWHRSIQSHYHTLNNHITHKDIGRFKRLFPRSRLPQRGQASYILTNLLPRTLLPVPHHHLRRPVGISQIGAKPE